MAQKQLYTGNNLNEVVDFSKKTTEETKAMIDQMLCKQIAIGSQMPSCAIKDVFIAKVQHVRTNNIEEIVSRLTGKMTYVEIEQVILSFFKF